jgi:hypothetical protein
MGEAELVEGDLKEVDKPLAMEWMWTLDLTPLPPGHRVDRDTEPVRQVFLRPAARIAEVEEGDTEGCGVTVSLVSRYGHTASSTALEFIQVSQAWRASATSGVDDPLIKGRVRARRTPLRTSLPGASIFSEQARRRRMEKQPGQASPGELELRDELERLRLWCASLEEQQAQLAGVLAVLAPDVAGLGLTRFSLGAALPDQFPVHGQQ